MTSPNDFDCVPENADVAPATGKHVGKQSSAVEATSAPSGAQSFFLADEASPLFRDGGALLFVKRGSPIQSRGAAPQLESTVSARNPAQGPLLEKSDGIPTGESAQKVNGHRAQYLRDYARAWIAARRSAYFKGKACVACGSERDLELDHIDPVEKVDSHIWSWSEERRLAEIAKCRVLCSSCHTRRHADENRKPLVHGTSNAYRRKGCRCEQCSAWNQDRVRDGRSRRAQLGGAL